MTIPLMLSEQYAKRPPVWLLQSLGVLINYEKAELAVHLGPNSKLWSSS